jgi:hypothetical protein
MGGGDTEGTLPMTEGGVLTELTRLKVEAVPYFFVFEHKVKGFYIRRLVNDVFNRHKLRHV